MHPVTNNREKGERNYDIWKLKTQYGRSFRSLAKEYGVSHGCIQQIVAHVERKLSKG